jgi:hypothetical protein
VPPCRLARIYKPSAPAGTRFVRTGARTRLARLYHATSLLTARGDILVVSGWQRWRVARAARAACGVRGVRRAGCGVCGAWRVRRVCCASGPLHSTQHLTPHVPPPQTHAPPTRQPPTRTRAHATRPKAGTSNGAFWTSSHAQDFDRTPLGVNEYRVEVYHPPYEFRPNRPRITGARVRWGWVAVGVSAGTPHPMAAAPPTTTTTHTHTHTNTQRVTHTHQTHNTRNTQRPSRPPLCPMAPALRSGLRLTPQRRWRASCSSTRAGCVCVCVCVCVCACVCATVASSGLVPAAHCVRAASRPPHSHLTPHTSHLTPHTSHATRHTSRLTGHAQLRDRLALAAAGL